MGDDACECICTFQWAMRRLGQIINQAQTYCTDEACNDPPAEGQTGPGGLPPMFLMMMFAMFMMMMFAMRPKAKERNEKEPPSGPPGGNNQPPPDVMT